MKTSSKGYASVLEESEPAGVIQETAGPAFMPVDIRDKLVKLEELVGEIAAMGHGVRYSAKGSVVAKPSVVLPELHDPESGRIDAQKVADYMGIPLKQLARALSANYKAIHRSPSASSLQSGLRPVKRALELLHQFFGNPGTIRAWLNTPHPDLDGASALEAISAGDAQAVMLILENAWDGVPV